MSEKGENVQRKTFKKTFRKPGELLTKTTLKDHNKIWPPGSKNLWK